jgi:hypothetical protein
VADQLGVASLLVSVEVGAALKALEKFRTDAESILKSVGSGGLAGLVNSAEKAGKAAGDKIGKGLKSSLSGLKFDNIAEALDFGGALNGTISDLKLYKDALTQLRDTTKTTTPGFKDLNAQIDNTSAAIKALSTSTDNLNDLLSRADAAAYAEQLKLWGTALRENEASLRSAGSAINSAERSIRSYDKASADAVQATEAQARAVSDLRDAYLGVAGAAVQAAAGAAGTAAKLGKTAAGVVGSVAKGAVSAGKAGYQVGSELGIFDAPNAGPVTAAVQKVSDRFKYLGEQASTARGILLRTFEGIGTGAGLLEVVKNADQLKSILSNLGGTANLAQKGLNDLAGTSNFLTKAFNSLGADWAGLKAPSESIVGNLINIADGAVQATAGAGSLADTFAQLGVSIGGGAIDALVGLNDLLSQVPVEAAGVSAAVSAALVVFGGPLQKQAAAGITELLNKIQNLGTKALQVRSELQNFYEGLNAKPQLALPSSDQLKPDQKGIQRLTPQTNSLIEATKEALALKKAEQEAVLEAERLQKALDTNRNIGQLLPNAIERGARWFQKSAEYAELIARYSKQAADNQPKQLLPSPTGQSAPLPNSKQYIRPIGPNPITGIQALDGKDYNLPMDATSKSIRRNDAKVKKQEAYEERQLKLLEETNANQKLIAAEKKKQAKSAAANARAESSAATKSTADRNRRIKDAAGGAIIGGAFPALFGQGLGASVGGALGGGGGGALGGQFGFGLSLVGTAVGDQFDRTTEKFKLLGEAAKDPITNFAALADAGLLSSKSVEKLAQGFIDTGDTASAAAIIQQDLANSYGDGSAAKALSEANRDLNRSYTELQVAIASLAAGGITAIVDETTKSLNGFTAALKFLKENLPQLPEGAGNAVKDAATDAVLLTAFPSVGSAALAGKTLNRIFAPDKAKSDATEKQKQLDLENKITAAAARTTKERSTQFQLTNAQVQGNRTALLDAQKQNAIDERNKKLRELSARGITDPNDARRVEANAAAALKLYELDLQRKQLQKELNTTIDQELIKRQQIAQQITASLAQRNAALAQGDLAANPGNSVLAARAGAAEGTAFLAQNRLGIEQAITRERELQAQLSQESDPTRQLQLVQQLGTAADEIRAAGVAAGTALAEKAASAAQSLQSAKDALRGTLESNYRLTTPETRQGLRDLANADVQRGKQSGILRNDFQTGSRSRLFEAAAFVRQAELQKAQITQQQSLIDALNANTKSERQITITLNGQNIPTSAVADSQAALL